MQTPIYDAFTGEPVLLGETLRSIERGDLVRVVELGQDWLGVPTIRLETIDQTPCVGPFMGQLVESFGHRYGLAMYTLA